MKRIWILCVLPVLAVAIYCFVQTARLTRPVAGNFIPVMEKTLSFPYTVTSGKINNEMTLKLQMISGRMIEMDEEKQYFGLEGEESVFDYNYIGQYQLSVLKGAEKIDSVMVSFGGDKEVVYDGYSFPIYFYDYNGDKNMDFTLGPGGKIGKNKVYNLYSITPEGKIYVLQEGIQFYSNENSVLLPSDEAGFVVLKYDEKEKTYYNLHYIWNGAFFEIGEKSVVLKEEEP